MHTEHLKLHLVPTMNMYAMSSVLRASLRPHKLVFGQRAMLSSVQTPMSQRPSNVRMMTSDGQISSDLMDSMRLKIEKALEADEVQVADVQGDGRHVEIVVVSRQFEGKSSVNRQRMVYKVRAHSVLVP